MKAYQLIANVAAAMLTFASVSAINYNLVRQPGVAPGTPLTRITNLAPIQVHPSADERRAAALLSGVSGSETITTAAPRATQSNATASFKLLESETAMPYYSFGKKFGRVSKE